MPLDEAFLLSNLQHLTPLELRTLNRYYLHPKGERCCNSCYKIYSDFPKHFHIKKHIAEGGISYNTRCANCFNKVNRERIKECRKTATDFIKMRFTSYLHRARGEGCKFDLTIEYLCLLWENQKGKCYLTDEDISFEWVTESGKAPHYLTPSLDRIDPTKGYTQGNVAWCAYVVNRLKNDLNYEDLLNVCNRILEVHERKNNGNLLRSRESGNT